MPSDELEVCCWWEYARESAFIRSVHQRSIDGNPSCGSMARIQGYGKYPWLIVDRFFGLGQFRFLGNDCQKEIAVKVFYLPMPTSPIRLGAATGLRRSKSDNWWMNT